MSKISPSKGKEGIFQQEGVSRTQHKCTRVHVSVLVRLHLISNSWSLELLVARVVFCIPLNSVSF